LRFSERQTVKEKKKEEIEVGQRHHTGIPSANLSSAISSKVGGMAGDATFSQGRTKFLCWKGHRGRRYKRLKHANEHTLLKKYGHSRGSERSSQEETCSFT
jgi:hypothetical protein